MSTHRSRGVDRHAAEQLLAGSGAGPLASVLRAAAAPAYPEELAGEDAVLAAFRDAPASEPRRASALRTALAKVLTVKALIVVAVAGSTGIVLAASGGALPLPWSEPWSDSPAGPSPVSSTAQTPAGTSQVSPPSGRTADTGAPPATADTPAPSELSRLTGLCEAYTAQVGEVVGEVKGTALETPAFTALVEAAGGAGKVDDYCATVVPTDPPRKPDDLPTPTSRGESGGAAGNIPTNIPTNLPSNVPGDPASSRPVTPPGRAPTPGSPAHGAATAVPSSGAIPPSKGG